MSGQSSTLTNIVKAIVDRKYAAIRRIISRSPTTTIKGLVRVATEQEIYQGSDVTAIAKPNQLHTLLTPYDIPFNAGFDGDMEAEDLEVKQYGRIILSRDLEIVDFVAQLQTPSVGSFVEIDIEYSLNYLTPSWVSIFLVKPRFAEGSTVITTVGTLTTANLAIPKGSIIRFRITNTGTSTPGARLNVGIAGRGTLV
jgi:hypothetical protein